MPKQKESIPIIQTKLYRPPVTEDIVPRPMLFDRLEKGKNLPLSLVIAPAGYGKSTLVSHWLEKSGFPSAWLSLEESDSDVRIFLTYLVAAIQTVSPKACTGLAARLRSRDLPQPRILAEELNRALNDIEEPLSLVLDDYHLISNRAIHDLITFQLKHRVPHLNLLLISRRDPPLPAPSLRAQNRLCEIRLTDLMFSLTETTTFLQQASPCVLDAETTGRLHDALEGWPVGLRLLLAALGDPPDPQRITEGISGGSSQIQDYLAVEVLSKLSPVRRKCISRISILDRFCAPLCQALCDHECGDDAPCMYHEHREGVTHDAWTPLCISLDFQNHWFRFHHVFQKVLQRNMQKTCPPEEIEEIHRRAMAWLEANGQIEEAMSHAQKIGDHEAASLIIRQRHRAMNNEQWVRLRHWMNQLSPETVEKSPDLLLVQAWCSLGYPEMFNLLDRAEKQLNDRPVDSETNRLRGEFLSYHSLRYYVASDPDNTIRAAEEALLLLNPEQLSERGFAHILRTLGKQMQGRFPEAQNDVFEALQDSSILQTTCHSRLLNALCFSYWMEACPQKLLGAANEYHKLGQQTGFVETIDLALYFIGLYHYASNELTEAADHLERVVQNPAVSNLHNYIHCVYALVTVRQAQRNDTEANRLAQKAVSMAFQTRNPVLLQQSQALEAELALRQGRLAEATQWAAEFDPASPAAMYRFYVPHFTQIRILIAQKDDLSIQEAVRRSAEQCELTEKTHNRQHHITSLILYSLALQERGKTEPALRAIGKALELAQPGGIIRSFIDEGPLVASLLNQLSLNNESLHFAGRIIAAIKKEGTGNSTGIPGDVGDLLDPLSNREHDVLTLMAEGLANKEIGEKLFISPGTVKRHTHSIYEKLGIHTRREAVIKADGLGLLN